MEFSPFGFNQSILAKGSQVYKSQKQPVGRDHATHHRSTETIPMPPHLHRRPPLRQPLPPPARVLLLPPHHPKTHRQPATTPQPPLHLPPAAARRPLRHPGLHRRSPAAHRRQRHRPPPRRPPPLRPPDRQPQPPQTPTRKNHRIPSRIPNHLPDCRRDHHRPRTRHPRPTHRSLRNRNPQKRRPPTHREHPARRAGRSSHADSGDKHHPHTQRRSCPVARASPQSRRQNLVSSSRTDAANRKIHPPLLSFLHRWPPHSCKRPNPPAPPP